MVRPNVGTMSKATTPRKLLAFDAACYLTDDLAVAEYISRSRNRRFRASSAGFGRRGTGPRYGPNRQGCRAGPGESLQGPRSWCEAPLRYRGQGRSGFGSSARRASCIAVENSSMIQRHTAPSESDTVQLDCNSARKSCPTAKPPISFSMTGFLLLTRQSNTELYKSMQRMGLNMNYSITR